jgi:hypothetical protein
LIQGNFVANEARRDIGGQEEVVDLEEAAKRQQNQKEITILC